MKRPREDSGGESDDEATEQSRGPSVSLEGGDVTSQGEEGNLPAVEMDVEREEEGEEVESGGQEESGEGERGENQEQGEGEHVEMDGEEESRERGEEQGEVEPWGDEEDVGIGVQEEGEGGEGEPQEEGEIPEQRGMAREEEMSRREAEEDLRFKDDLDTRRSRQEKKVDSLQNLTLKCISDNTDYFLDHSEDVHSLPGPLFRLVVNHLVKNVDKTELPDILPLVISEKTLKLDICFASLWTTPDVWSPETVAKVVGLIEEKCKINTILASLENLTTLSIYRGNFGVTDATLLVLGQNCLKLSFLNLYGMQQITDTGVDYLCARAAPYGQCKNLETLNLENTSVSVDGLVAAFSNLPKLKDLRHFDLFAALVKYVKINGVSKQLNLKKLDCTGNAVLAPFDWENVCKIIPHATSFIVDYEESLRPFFNINAISIFDLEQSGISLQELNSFITHFSSSLTSFSMYHCDSEIDLSVFGCCPNLEVLVLYCSPNLSTNQFQLLPSSFMKLKELTIFPRSLPNITILELDVPYLMQMVSSPAICKLRLGYITLPEASLYSLIVEAKENHTVFSSLESFGITENEYSLNTLKQLICVCPKLSALHCRMSQESKLQRFVERNNLQHIRIIGPL